MVDEGQTHICHMAYIKKGNYNVGSISMDDSLDSRIRSRLISILGQRGVSQAEIARKAHISHTNLNRFLVDKRKGLGTDTIYKLAQALGVPSSYFLDDNDGMIYGNAVAISMYDGLPIDGRQAIGSLITDLCMLSSQPLPNETLWLKIIGNSLAPTFKHDDFVLLVRRSIDEVINNELVVVTSESVTTIKRAYSRPNNSIELKPEVAGDFTSIDSASSTNFHLYSVLRILTHV